VWKPRSEEERSTTPGGAPIQQPMNTPRMAQPDQARIGKGVQVNGEISGAEDLYVDGEVQGSITLRDQVLTIGPNANVRASIDAGQVIVQGAINGNITAKRVELKGTAKVVGDVSTERIVMEDGAYLKGGVDVHKAERESRQESKAAAASSSTASTPEEAPVLAHAGSEEKKV
jgi:cytoskeletal protein CcmA (bactofilin family)